MKLVRLRHFRACRVFLPRHCHVNGLCPIIPAEWEDMRRRPSTYALWYAFREALR